MEWVETTGKTVAEALDAALDQLGVDEIDAEYEVVTEPKMGLFGRIKAEARIRVRVRPSAPPSKDVVNGRRRRVHKNGKFTPNDEQDSTQDIETSQTAADDSSIGEVKKAPREGSGKSRSKSARKVPVTPKRQGAFEMAEEDIPLVRQGEIAREFLSGLLNEINLPVDVNVSIDEPEEIVSISVSGDNLGFLIGPKGATLQSLHDLTRTVVQRQTGARNGRVIVDVGQYREKRRDALERFARQVAVEVLASGEQRILEPMNSADRKIVHDLIAMIGGVSTSSEGEEPRRRVVIRNDNAAEVG